MIRFDASFLVPCLLSLMGCGGLGSLDSTTLGIKKRPLTILSQEQSPFRKATRSEHSSVPKEFAVIGTWVSSGWMGDANSGALTHRICTEDAHRPAPEEWVYDPAKGSLGFVAVAYQFPDGNFGSARGKNLSGSGFTTLRVVAKGKKGGECIVFTSGGNTKPDARYPASYETRSCVVSLKSHWETYELPVGNDLSNVPSAFGFILTRQMNPMGCTFYLKDAAFGTTQK